jgi:hypothetical protein
MPSYRMDEVTTFSVDHEVTFPTLTEQRARLTTPMQQMIEFRNTRDCLTTAGAVGIDLPTLARERLVMRIKEHRELGPRLSEQSDHRLKLVVKECHVLGKNAFSNEYRPVLWIGLERVGVDGKSSEVANVMSPAFGNKVPFYTLDQLGVDADLTRRVFEQSFDALFARAITDS